ncbi:MAG TPA: hypothetical protein VLC10_05445, partial [Patescibacteria group bacterium]|nr:hypothetical protein [Patescibacteria group bacterium]
QPPTKENGRGRHARRGLAAKRTDGQKIIKDGNPAHIPTVYLFSTWPDFSQDLCTQILRTSRASMPWRSYEKSGAGPDFHRS